MTTETTNPETPQEIKPFKRITFDLEANGLLEMLIDFDNKPLRFKPEARLWCVSVRCIDTGKSVILVPDEYLEVDPNRNESPEMIEAYGKLIRKPLSLLPKIMEYAELIVGHNIIKYDLPTLKLFGCFDYQIAYPEMAGDAYKTQDMINETPVKFIDTLVLSQLLWADRPGGHSLANFGKIAGDFKLDFDKFEEFSYEMCVYCEQDTVVSVHAYKHLLEEKQQILSRVSFAKPPATIFDAPYIAEAKLADLMIKQELYGFNYDSQLSTELKTELIPMIQAVRDKIDPQLPPRPMNKGELAKVTPPKVKVKKDGNLGSHMVKFLERVGGTYDCITNTYTVDGKEFSLDYEGPVKDTITASVDDLDHLKGYLIDLGWEPSSWKPKDLSVDSKKRKRTSEEMPAAIKAYVAQSFAKPYSRHRMAHFNLPANTTPEAFEKHLMALWKKSPNRGIKCLGTPELRVGAEKAICPKLQELVDDGKVDFATDLVHFLTYKHRLSSIAGSVGDEDEEPTTGFESRVRSNGTIPTVINSNATNTGRMAHAVVDLLASALTKQI